MAKQVKQEVNIDQVITELQELVMSQQKALETADYLIDLRKIQNDIQQAIIDNCRLRLRHSYVVAFILAIGWLVTLAMFLSRT